MAKKKRGKKMCALALTAAVAGSVLPAGQTTEARAEGLEVNSYEAGIPWSRLLRHRNGFRMQNSEFIFIGEHLQLRNMWMNGTDSICITDPERAMIIM